MQMTTPKLCNYTTFTPKHLYTSQCRNPRSRSKDNGWVRNLISCFYLNSLWSSLRTHGISASLWGVQDWHPS